MIGLFAFYYIFLHLITYIVLDHYFLQPQVVQVVMLQIPQVVLQDQQVQDLVAMKITMAEQVVDLLIVPQLQVEKQHMRLKHISMVMVAVLSFLSVLLTVRPIIKDLRTELDMVMVVEVLVQIKVITEQEALVQLLLRSLYNESFDISKRKGSTNYFMDLRNS